MTETAKQILVLGGTGHYGRRAVASLLAKNVAVRVLSRDAERARRTLGDGPEIVSGDITEAASLESAFKQIDGLIVAVSAFSPGQIRRMKEIEHEAVIAAFDRAKQSGIGRVVYISVFEIQKEFAARQKLAGADLKAAVEERLARSGLNWTILGAPPSMELFFAMIRGSSMMVPGGGPPAGLPTISSLDVGEIAAQAVLRSDLKGRRIRMVGPEAIRFPDAARRIGAVWGRKITFRRIPFLLPRIAYLLTAPLASLSDRMLFVHSLLGYVRLLNRFPPEYSAAVPEMHRELRQTFRYEPTTLEMEAAHRKADR